MKSTAKILVVDDDPILREILSDTLRIKGYETAVIGTGTEAIVAAAHETFSLALIDLMLPDMHGIEVMERIKAVSPLTEAIILTGHASMDTAIEATKRGAFSYLLKPYQVDDLLQNVRHGVERQQAQEEILRLASFPRLSPNPVVELDSAGGVTYVNPAAEKLFPGLSSIGQSHPLLNGLPEMIIALRQSRQQEEVVHEAKIGNATYELHISYVQEVDLTRIYIMDITQRKQAQDQVRASLAEKEVLLQEIHHRVKNNLQIVISLLRLQSRQITDKYYLELLKEIQARIRVMSLIHEKLYRSADFTRIGFKDYIKSLAEGLMNTYGTNGGRVTLEIDAEAVFLEIDKAIPCGLIINELITNAIKYAFPDDRKGKISILLHQAPGNEIELIIRDNGIGLPEELDIRKTPTMGMQLVTSLAEDQLRGKLELEHDKGAGFRIRFKKQ